MNTDRSPISRTLPAAFVLTAVLVSACALPARSQLCANPGKDGPGGTLTGVINTYYPGTATAAAGSFSIPVGAPSGAATPIAAGDLLLVIQMQDAAINATNTDSYGDGVAGAPASGSSSLNNAGRYEYVVATGPVAAGAVPILGEGVGNGLLYTYTLAAASGSQGQRRFQIVRVPQYSVATLGSGLTCSAWDGSIGGVLAVDVAGSLALGSATVDVSGRGFRGGLGRGLAGASGGANTDYRTLAANLYHGSKGEGVAGTPRYVLNSVAGTAVDTGVDGYPNGSSARGAPGNAGGGGTDGHPSSNDENSGGGGGGNGGTGGGGGNTWNSNLARGGHGGVFSPAVDRVAMGGGGGAGARNNSSGTLSSGGAGGAIVFVRAGTVSGSGTITTNGVTSPAPANDGGGGGGAGGSVVVYSTGSLAGLTVHAHGATGTNADVGGSAHGPGGGGGGGFVALSSAATVDVVGGAAGYTVNAGNNYGATAGTGGTSVTTLGAAQMPGQDPGATCLPQLVVSKTTSTPAVVNTASGTTATWTITVSNTTGSAATQVSVTDSLPAGFTYASTSSVNTSGGAARTATSNPTAGDAVAAWGAFDIPAGGSVSITFVANVAASVTPGTYQNPARATYLDPARSTVNGTTSVAYAPLSSNAEDVTVTVPDLTIDKRHTANFTVGANGSYTLVVRNVGSAATSGTITVRDTLPVGLAFVSGTGTGWTVGVAGQVVTATNPGPIAAGDSASFALTVSVAAPAVPSVTNSATVSGGGDTSTGNNRDSDPTTVTGVPDLTIDKRHTANFTVGANGTYTLVVRNVGSAASTGTITVRDTLPAGLAFVSGTGTGWTVGTAGQIVTATNPGPIAAGDSASFALTVSVAAPAVPSVTNSATVSGGGDTSTGNNRDSDPTTIAGVPDLTIDKRHTANFAVGANGTYTLVVTNVGSAASAGGITVRDTLPAGLTFVGAAGAWTVVQNGQIVTATLGNVIAAGDSSSFTLTVSASAPAVPSVTNSATVSGGGDVNGANNRDSDPTTVAGAPDLTIDKRHTANFAVGANGTYTLVVTNVGSGASAGTITVRDTLPAGLAFVSGTGTGWTVGAVGQVVTATNPGPIAAGDSSSFTLTMGVSAPAVPSVTNSAAVSGGGDVSTGNNRDSDPTTVAGATDLTIDKRHTANFAVGANGTYTLVVTNVGSAASAGGITVRDTLPAGLTFVGAAGAWTVVQNGQIVTATLGNVIAPGDSSSFTLTVSASAPAVPSVTNSATVSGGGDTSASNNRDSDPTTVAGVTDLTLDKRHTANFAVGSNGTYTFVVTNVGSAASTGTITVRDTLPTGLAFVSGTGTGWTVGAAGQVVTATNPGPISAGDSASFTLTVSVAAAAVPSVINSATVSGGGDTSASNNRDSDPTTVAGVTDLTLDKRHNANFAVGSNGTYTFVVTNVGSAASAGTITVRDTLPAGLAFVSGTGSGWTIGAAGQVVTATNPGPIAAGDSASFTLTVAVSAPAVPSVTNSAAVSGGGDTSTGNNRDSDPTTISGVPDLTIDKRHTANFSVGANGTYTLVVRNVGSAATSGTITVRDTLPAGLAFVSGTGTGWTVGAAGQIVTATSPGPIAAGDSASFTLTVSVAAAAVPSVTNSATVSGGGDTSTSNNRDSDPTTIAGAPDLTVDKRHTTGFVLGGNGTYALVVTNVGSAASAGTITVRDTLPTGLAFVSGTGAGWTVGAAGQVVTATNPGPISAGDSASFTLTVSVAAAAVPSVTNSATVSGGGDTSTSNNRDSDPTTVAGLADLALDKRHASTFTVGGNAGYTFVVTNVGSAASGSQVTVRDTLPAGLSYVSSAGTGWLFSVGGSIVVATHAAPIAAGDSASFTLAVAVDAAAFPSVTNRARVSSNGTDPVPGNDVDSDPATVAGVPDVALVKSNASAFAVGANATYRLSLRNVGTIATTGIVTVRDTLPAGLAFVSGAGAGWVVNASGAVVAGTFLAPIAVADSAFFTLTVAVGAAAAPSVTNHASVSGGGDTNPANDRGASTSPVSGYPDLTLDKRHSGTFSVGTTQSYTFVVRNVGTLPENGTITVRDTLPVGLTYASAAGSGWTFGTSGAVVTATNPGPLAAGDSLLFTINVLVGAAAAPSVTNSASVSALDDGNPTNDRDSDPTGVTGAPDIAVDKRHTVAFTAGQPASWHIVVRNVSAAPTGGTTVVTDDIPAGVRSYVASGAGWVFNSIEIVQPYGNSGRLIASYAGVIAPGDSATFDIVAQLNDPAPDRIVNTVTAGTPGDVNLSNNADADTASVAGGVAVALGLTKTASPTTAELGGLVDYTLVVSNVGAITASDTHVLDHLPAGFRYVSGTVRVDGQKVADPTGSPGPQLDFTVGDVPANRPVTLRYRVVVGAGAGLGTGVNTAIAQAPAPGGLLYASAVAAAKVQVKSGPFSDDGIIAGKLYVDCNCPADGTQGAENTGIPGVRVLLEDGTAAITDVEGKYSFNHVAPRLHVIRVDETTLPAGAVLADEGTRTAGAAHSRFVDLHAGELYRADFREVSGDDHVRDVVRHRRTQGEVTQAADPFAEFGLLHVTAATREGHLVPSYRWEAVGRGVFEDLGNSSTAVVLPRPFADDSSGKDYSTIPMYHLRTDSTGYVVPGDGKTLLRFLPRPAWEPGTRITIETTAGRFTSSDLDPIAPGVQTLVGRDFWFLPPARPGDAMVRTTSGDVSDSTIVHFIPASHPLLVSGLIDARIDWHSSKFGDTPGIATDGFTEALQDVGGWSDEGGSHSGGRGAVYVTGDVGHGATLTGRYDTESDRERRMFRDIRPFEGYDLVGDASVHEWNAPSDSRLYLRVDRQASFAQFGDFTTPMHTGQQLGAFQRSINGAVTHLGDGRVQADAFATQGRSHQVVDELPGLGVSGPYTLSRSDGTLGSEQVEIVTRDRNQPSRILSRRAMVRFADYTVEPFTGRLLFRQPVPGVDVDLNPVSVRVTYEAESVGDAYWTFGGGATVKPTAALTLGAAASRDEDPAKPANLASVDAAWTPVAGLRLAAEAARSDSGSTFLAGDRHGAAWRSELAIDRTDFRAKAFASRVDGTFDNASAGTGAGRAEWGANATLPLGTRTHAFLNALRTEDLVTHGRRTGFELGASRTLGDGVTAEFAYRNAEETSTPASPLTAGAAPNQASSVRGRVTAALPDKVHGSAFLELEEDLDQSTQKRWAVGADARVAARTRLYAQHENIASFAGPFALNTAQQQAHTVIGIASDELRDGQVFTEYRARDAFAGRDAQAAFGVRNRWAVAPGVRVDASFERLSVLEGPGAGGSPSTSVTSGVEWTGDPLWKGTARVEVRDAGDADQWLATLGASRKLDRDWSTLGRLTWLGTPFDEATARRYETQVGLAYRQTDANRVNGLARWQRQYEGNGDVGSSASRRTTNVVRADVNVKPAVRWTLSGQVAAKWLRDRSPGNDLRTTTQLLGGRALVDLTRRFDAGFAGRVLSGTGGQKRWGAGGEVGIGLARGLRGALGWNVFGFQDDGLGLDRSDRGPYVQMGFKFDEATLGLGRK